jgi:hypothetical protein
MMRMVNFNMLAPSVDDDDDVLNLLASLERVIVIPGVEPLFFSVGMLLMLQASLPFHVSSCQRDERPINLLFFSLLPFEFLFLRLSPNFDLVNRGTREYRGEVVRLQVAFYACPLEDLSAVPEAQKYKYAAGGLKISHCTIN